MKEYRLAAWPELPPHYQRAAYRRLASDMSHRHLTIAQLADLSGLKRIEVRHFVDMLESKGLLLERECMTQDAQFWSLRPLGGWLRRAMAGSHPGR